VTEVKTLERISSPENLALALNYAKDGAKRFFLPDFFRHQDYVHDSKNLLRELSIRLKRREYRPKPAVEVDIPKSGLAVRPGVVLDFEDFVVLYAIILPYIEQIDRKLPENVYSWRLAEEGQRNTGGLFQDRPIPLLPAARRKEIQAFEEWYEAWPEFDRDTKQLIVKEGYTHLVISDITAYFENISHDVLRGTLLRCMDAHAHYPVNLLIDILSQWTVLPPHGARVGRGIPQGNDISSYLGNIYLLPLDEVLCGLERSEGIRYLRYMDDVKILAKSRPAAMKALFAMNRVLRELQLNVQGAKTNIYVEHEMMEILSHPRMDAMNPIIEEILKKSRAGWIPQDECLKYEEKLRPFLSLPRKLKEQKDVRLFKRLLTGLSKIRRGTAIHRAMSSVVAVPGLTDKIVSYFKVFRTGEKISRFLYGYIAGRGELFEYQIARFIEVFCFKNSVPAGLLNTLLGFVQDSDTHWAIRRNALIALSFLELSQSQMRKLRQFSKDEINHAVKRAFLLCFMGTPPKWRAIILEHAKLDGDRRVSLFAKFLSDIMSDLGTQKYELSNLENWVTARSPLFVDESYKLLLLRDSRHLSVLIQLCRLLSKIKNTYYPVPVRWRIEESLRIARENLRKIQAAQARQGSLPLSGDVSGTSPLSSPNPG